MAGGNTVTLGRINGAACENNFPRQRSPQPYASGASKGYDSAVMGRKDSEGNLNRLFQLQLDEKERLIREQ